MEDISVSAERLQRISVQALAHVGDGVYELMVRARLCAGGVLTARELHRRSVGLVRCAAQAQAAREMIPLFTEEENRVFVRGRNAKHLHPPRGADLGDYCLATGLECLFGYLYLSGRTPRLTELFAAAGGEALRADRSKPENSACSREVALCPRSLP